MNYPNSLKLWHVTGRLKGQISVPASKSESNRALIINALTQGKCSLANLSEANDTKLLQEMLSSKSQELNAQDAGTAMRFFTAFAAVTNQQKTLTGTLRMQERPIGLLVDALRELGADIEYLNSEGYPPLQINGIDLSWPAQEITVPGHISSQYISALLLVAPLLPQGLRLTISGHIASRPYIDMTVALMQHFGAKCSWQENTLVTEPHPYEARAYSIPADWSSAAYWFSFCALAEEAQLFLPGLQFTAHQADSAVVAIAENWGVKSQFTEEGCFLIKTQKELPRHLQLNFSDCPDLAPTILVLAAATGVTVNVTGLESLAIKETDRIAALQTELLKIGAQLQQIKQAWVLSPATENNGSEISIRTYSDHRIAMAFAPLALHRPLLIEEPGVVKKSYPDFWEQVKRAGFNAEFADRNFS